MLFYIGKHCEASLCPLMLVSVVHEMGFICPLEGDGYSIDISYSQVTLLGMVWASWHESYKAFRQ